MFFKIIHILFILFCSFGIINSQFSSQKDDAKKVESIPFDAIVFKNDNATKDSVGRIDIFFAVPYELLRFSEKNEYYESEFKAVIRIFNPENQLIIEDAFSQPVYAKSYFDAQGGNGGFKPMSRRYNIIPGMFKITVSVQDKGGRQLAEASKQLVVPEYSAFSTSVSGIMIVSSITEENGKLKITPHLSDNVFDLQDGFNIFYQVYSETVENAFLDWEIKTEDGDIVLQGNEGIKTFQPGKNQERIFISQNDTLPIDRLIVSITLNKTGEGGDIIAKADRNIDNVPSFGFAILKDIDDAISKLALTASASEIDGMQSLDTENAKRAAFFAYWDKNDPTPNTRKNEAFEEYYSRIEYANAQFSTYAKGWLTDMGRVYIVLGPPDNVNNRTSFNTQMVEQVWNYNNIGSFVFRDASGFGDFRLVQPIGFRRSYRYGDRDGN